MKNTLAPLTEYFEPALKEKGFIRAGDSWFRTENDSVLVVNLQPSFLASFVNLGVFYSKYGAATRPKIAQCHAWTRLEALVPDPLRMMELSNPASDVTDDVRRDEMQQLLVTYGLPWLEGMSKFDTAPSFLAKETSKGVVISKEARADLKK